MDTVEAIATGVASAVSGALATAGWRQFKGLLVRVVRRSGGGEVAPELEQRLQSEEERWANEAPSAEHRAAIDREWFELLYPVLQAHPEVAKALSEQFALGRTPHGRSSTVQFNTAKDHGSIIAPAGGDVTINYGPRGQTGGGLG